MSSYLETRDNASLQKFSNSPGSESVFNLEVILYFLTKVTKSQSCKQLH